MIRAIIIDDEPKNIRILSSMIQDFCPEVTIAGEADNAQTGMELIKKEKPDLLFLDIEMSHGNAFDMLDKLQPADFEVIFVTAFDSYTLKAFKYSALDYLLKPVDIDELQLAVKKASERLKLKNTNTRLDNLLQNLRKPAASFQKLAFPAKEGLIFVPVTEIIRCEANGGYTYIYTETHDKIISSKNIKEYEDLLPEDFFFRIHNSHLINLNFVKKYHKGRGGLVEMNDGTMVEVAARRKDDFLSRFG